MKGRNNIKILSVVGARPNYIKLAAVYKFFSDLFEHIIVDTGQHYDYEMNRIFFDQLEIPEPHYFLGVGSGSHGYQVGEIIKRIEETLLRERPDLVVVYGDTNSALGGALAAIKSGFRVAHVEAGLRSFDMSMPEEINRKVIDHVSHLLFSPTSRALHNLINEKVFGKVFLTGDVHVNILREWLPIAEERSDILKRLGLIPENYALVTIHRAENVDNISRLTKILDLIRRISEYEKVVFPVHPRTRKNMINTGLNNILASDRIILTQPLGYIDFIKLLRYSKIVLTDSGGVQREGYLLKRPVIILRKTTEWIELVENRLALLCDVEEKIDIEKIIEYRPEKYVEGLLGDEKAPERIAEIIYKFLKK
jgi:UDP-N-acetylglucosamine 2-epimerase (non-hydrolysing)